MTAILETAFVNGLFLFNAIRLLWGGQLFCENHLIHPPLHNPKIQRFDSRLLYFLPLNTA